METAKTAMKINWTIYYRILTMVKSSREVKKKKKLIWLWQSCPKNASFEHWWWILNLFPKGGDDSYDYSWPDQLDLMLTPSKRRIYGGHRFVKRPIIVRKRKHGALRFVRRKSFAFYYLESQYFQYKFSNDLQKSPICHFSQPDTSAGPPCKCSATRIKNPESRFIGKLGHNIRGKL